MGGEGLAGHRAGVDEAGGLGERPVPSDGHGSRRAGDCGAAGSRTGRDQRWKARPTEPAAKGTAEKDPTVYPDRSVRCGAHRLSGALRHGMQGIHLSQYQGQRAGSERHDLTGSRGRADQGISGAVRRCRFDRGGGREVLYSGYEQGAGSESGRGGGTGVCPWTYWVLPSGSGLAVLSHQGLSQDGLSPHQGREGHADQRQGQRRAESGYSGGGQLQSDQESGHLHPRHQRPGGGQGCPL